MLLNVIRRFQKWLVLAMLVGGLAAISAAILTGKSTQTYQATATVQVVPSDASVSPDQINTGRAIPVAVAVMEGPDVARQVESDLNLDYSVDGAIAVTSEGGSPIMTVQATDSSPDRAAQIANRVVEDFAVVTRAKDQVRRDNEVQLLQEQIRAQEAVVRADAAAVAPLSGPSSLTNPSNAGELAVLSARERVDSGIYSQMLNQLQQLQNNPLEDYQLSVLSPATASGVVTPHSSRYLKIGLAALAGVVGVLSVGFLLTTPLPTGQFRPSAALTSTRTVSRRAVMR